MQNTLQRLFQCKAWANDELLTSVAKIEGNPAVIGLAIKALSHTHVVDCIFAAHLQRKGHPYTSANLRELPTLERLSADIRETDAAFVEYVSGLDPQQLSERIDFTFTDGKPGRMSREEMLMHVITHGAYHRGQISAAMLLDDKLPARDGFTTWLHEAEAPTRRRLAA